MLTIRDLYYAIKCERMWRVCNANNFTRVGKTRNKIVLELLASGRIEIGDKTYGRINIDSSNAENEGLRIGAFCSISNQATFLLSGEHNIDTVSTYPFDAMLFGECVCRKSKGPIVLEDDVWVGDHALILSGVHIGRGAIIAAGAVVAKDVPPYAIVGGNPARVIRYRFDEETIKKLMEIDFQTWDDAFLAKNKENLYRKATDSVDWVKS